MILEHVLITVDPAATEAYQAAFLVAKPLVAGQPGCRSVRLLPAHERPGAFLLLIEWEQIKDHVEGFRKSVEYQEWARLLHPFYEVFPEVRYFGFP